MIKVASQSGLNLQSAPFKITSNYQLQQPNQQLNEQCSEIDTSTVSGGEDIAKTGAADTSLDNVFQASIANHSISQQKYQSYQNTPSKQSSNTMTCNSKAFSKQINISEPPNCFIGENQKESSEIYNANIDGGKQNYRTPPQNSKKQGSINYNNYFNGMGSNPNQALQSGFDGNVLNYMPTAINNSQPFIKKLSNNSSTQGQNQRQQHTDFMQFPQSIPLFEPNLMPAPLTNSSNPYSMNPYNNVATTSNQPQTGLQSTFGGQQHYSFYPSPFLGASQNFDMTSFNYNMVQQPIPSVFYPTLTPNASTPSTPVQFSHPQLSIPPQPLSTPPPSSIPLNPSITASASSSSVLVKAPTIAVSAQQQHHQQVRTQQSVHYKQQQQLTAVSRQANHNMPNSARNLNKVSSHIVGGGTNGSGEGGVIIQPMNLSQSMQEQSPQFMQAYINQDNNIFYQDQSLIGTPQGSSLSQSSQDTFTPKLSQSTSTQVLSTQQQEPVFTYVEKSASNTFNNAYGGVNLLTMQPPPMTCYSPQQQYSASQSGHYPQQHNVQNDVLPNPFSYQRVSAAQSQQHHPQYYEQSQDLIFQIFNSIKSNHSMSPIPQIMSPPPILDFQMSQHSSDHLSQSCGGAPNGCSSGHQNARTTNNTLENQQENQFYEQLDSDIDNYLKQVQESINVLKPERDFVLAKIAEVAQKVFPGETPKLEVFGSLVTGLALESSDMDLAVTGLHIDDRSVMIADLNSLAHGLQNWQCLSSFKAIDTASIPVIKMKVDLDKMRKDEMTESEEGDFAKRCIPENQRYLSIDITFDDSSVNNSSNPSHSSPYGNQLLQSVSQSLLADLMMEPGMQTKTHLGLQSCALVQQYIANYRHLKPVSILLKRFLALHNFNSPYYGGLSSYSTVILIVAYMNFYGLKGVNNPEMLEMSPSRLLMGFLEFYGSYFNPGTMSISVLDDGSFFSGYSGNNSMMGNDSNFVILDPLNLQNNTTKNSYLTKEILQKFNCAFNNLKSQMSKVQIGSSPNQQQQLPHAVHSSQTALSRASSLDNEKSIIPSPSFEKASNTPIVQNANEESKTNNPADNSFERDGDACLIKDQSLLLLVEHEKNCIVIENKTDRDQLTHSNVLADGSATADDKCTQLPDIASSESHQQQQQQIINVTDQSAHQNTVAPLVQSSSCPSSSPLSSRNASPLNAPTPSPPSIIENNESLTVKSPTLESQDTFISPHNNNKLEDQQNNQIISSSPKDDTVDAIREESNHCQSSMLLEIFFSKDISTLPESQNQSASATTRVWGVSGLLQSPPVLPLAHPVQMNMQQQQQYGMMLANNHNGNGSYGYGNPFSDHFNPMYHQHTYSYGAPNTFNMNNSNSSFIPSHQAHHQNNYNANSSNHHSQYYHQQHHNHHQLQQQYTPQNNQAKGTSVNMIEEAFTHQPSQ